MNSVVQVTGCENADTFTCRFFAFEHKAEPRTLSVDVKGSTIYSVFNSIFPTATPWYCGKEHVTSIDLDEIFPVKQLSVPLGQ